MMKKILLSGCIIFYFLAAQAQKVTARIDITNIPIKQGVLYVGWYSTADGFREPDKAVFKKGISLAKQSETTVEFSDIPVGAYAIAVFYDENGNYVLDKNFLGIPKEKYGFSNNVYHSTRPASFEESLFRLEKDHQIVSIKLN
jgi:uncharacterized protein (DUF2141 family)